MVCCLAGLDHEGLRNRTAAACSEIREKCPDVVFVQVSALEVVANVLEAAFVNTL